jgi:2'-5' RNA ligase
MSMANEGKTEKARVFFAMWPHEVGQKALAAWQPLLREQCGGRSMRAETLHATLVFIGDVALHRLEALQLAAQEVEVAAFELCWDQARYWGHNHIAYAAPSEVPQRLLDLVHRLEQNLLRHRFRFDRRSYKPHITLLRHAKWSDAPLTAVPAFRCAGTACHEAGFPLPCAAQSSNPSLKEFPCLLKSNVTTPP